MDFRTLRAIGLTLTLATCAASTQAGVIFEDNFDSYSPTLDWDGGAKWQVSPAGDSVDLVAHGTYSINCQGNAGNCVDLDGTTGGPGTLAAVPAIQWKAGLRYSVMFDLAGNDRGELNYQQDPDDTVIVAAMNALGSITLLPNDTWSTFLYSFIGDGSTSRLRFTNTGNDNIGILLDNVKITVPEPGSLALLALGFAGLGFNRRKR